MKCKRCGAENPEAKRCCTECGAILEGYTLNNVTGEYGYRGADGQFYKSEEDYLQQSSAACSGQQPTNPTKAVVEEVIQQAMHEHLQPLVTQITQLLCRAFQAGADAGLKCGKYVNYQKKETEQ